MTTLNREKIWRAEVKRIFIDDFNIEVNRAEEISKTVEYRDNLTPYEAAGKEVLHLDF